MSELQKNRTKEANTIHACSGKNITVEYKTWKRMRQRCKNKNTSYYGKDGIEVCERWDSFANFLADMGKRPDDNHTLDRINGNLGYSPDNCRWATRKQQQRNLKNNHIVEYLNIKMTVAQLAETVGIKYTTIINRLYRGLSVNETINKPIRGMKK